MKLIRQFMAVMRGDVGAKLSAGDMRALTKEDFHQYQIYDVRMHFTIIVALFSIAAIESLSLILTLLQ